MRDELEGITTAVLDALPGGAPLDPLALTFLLRRYLDTDRRDVGDALGEALARAFDGSRLDATTTGRAGWLTLFAEAAAISDDARVHDEGARLVEVLSRDWPAATRVGDAAASVDACLRGADFVDPSSFIPAAIDELERIVGGAYRPGAGVGAEVGGAASSPRVRHDQIRASSALLTAFTLTARLPYSMLAEELMQSAKAPGGDFGVDCDAARVLCRLAALHDDAEYRAAAIVDERADYRRDADALLRRWSPSILERGAGAAAYGIALMERTGLA